MVRTMNTPKAGRRQKRLRQPPTSKPRKPAPRSVSLDEERIKQLMKQAVREVLEEERELREATMPSTTGQSEPRERVDPLAGKSREELRALALAAEGSWRESEGTGTSVEIVRRLRDEWKHRPS